MFVSIVHAETYKLQCIYEVGGNKSITIDEQNSKVINTPGGSWNYRKVSEYVYVYEVASLQKQTINRYIVDLENLFVHIMNWVVQPMERQLRIFGGIARGSVSRGRSRFAGSP